jgi:pantetheine-phosphate adenylyltransferase
MKYKKVAVGGSFDVLHRGHEALLNVAFDAGEFVLIGLTSSEMVTKDVAAYEKRKRALEDFLKNKGGYDIVELNDPLGPAATDESIEAIVVSDETRPGALEINETRKKNGLKTLEIISIPLVLADDQKPISSTRIKRGEIDKEGRILADG